MKSRLNSQSSLTQEHMTKEATTKLSTIAGSTAMMVERALLGVMGRSAE